MAETITRVSRAVLPAKRQFSHYVTDPHLPFKPGPLTTLDGISETGEFAYHYAHNSAGLRDVERARRKDPAVRRILALGDSFTYGIGAAFEETYPAQLQAGLNRRQGRHPPVEVVNAGIPGYFPAAERLFLEHYGVDYAPDLVLVGFLPNDVIDTHMGLGAVVVDRSGYLVTREAARLGSFAMWLTRNSDLARLALARFQISEGYRTVRWRELHQSNGFHEKDWRAIERELEQMVALARRVNARVVVVSIPERGPWTEKHRYPAERLGAWASRHGAELIDVLPAMIDASGRHPSSPLYYEKDGHCTPAGYAVIATEVSRALAERELVP